MKCLIVRTKPEEVIKNLEVKIKGIGFEVHSTSSKFAQAYNDQEKPEVVLFDVVNTYSVGLGAEMGGPHNLEYVYLAFDEASVDYLEKLKEAGIESFVGGNIFLKDEEEEIFEHLNQIYSNTIYERFVLMDMREI